jgi:hypothetical protein
MKEACAPAGAACSRSEAPLRTSAAGSRGRGAGRHRHSRLRLPSLGRHRCLLAPGRFRVGPAAASEGGVTCGF